MLTWKTISYLLPLRNQFLFVVGSLQERDIILSDFIQIANDAFSLLSNFSEDNFSRVDIIGLDFLPIWSQHAGQFLKSRQTINSNLHYCDYLRFIGCYLTYISVLHSRLHVNMLCIPGTFLNEAYLFTHVLFLNIIEFHRTILFITSVIKNC